MPPAQAPQHQGGQVREDPVEQLDKAGRRIAIEAERKVDRKKYAMTVYARAVYYMRRFVERLQSGGSSPMMQPASRLIQDFVDICARAAQPLPRHDDDEARSMTTCMYHSVNTCAHLDRVRPSSSASNRAQMHELGHGGPLSRHRHGRGRLGDPQQAPFSSRRTSDGPSTSSRCIP
jgi:hypothetical protein